MEPRNIVFLVVVALLVAFVSAKHQPKCGDGVTQSYYYNPLLKQYVTEECDDGNKRDNDGCSHLCQNEVCGDGIVQTNEECDGEPLCDMYVEHVLVNCKWMRCGDGFVQAANGEECDGGNAVSGDGCSDVCKIEFCGDGVLQLGLVVEGTELIDPLYEQCDDGNTDNGDGCNMFCQLEYCGDGIVQPELGEMCDLGAQNMETGAFEFFPYAWCNPQCQCIGFETWFDEGYATALQTCPGADNYGPVSQISGGMCAFPIGPNNGNPDAPDVPYTLTPGVPVTVTAHSYPQGFGSPFYGEWDIDLQGEFNVDFPEATYAEAGTYFKFTTVAAGVVHITNNVAPNPLYEVNEYFLEVYDRPCAAPTNYIASNTGYLYFDVGVDTSVADLFFYAEADKEYYLFAGQRYMYHQGTDYSTISVLMQLVPYTELVIPTTANDAPAQATVQLQSAHDSTYYVVTYPNTFPMLMQGRWFHFVVPDFGLELGATVDIELSTYIDINNDYSFIYLYPGGTSVNFASDDYPTATLVNRMDRVTITTTVSTDWWVLVQIPNPTVIDPTTCEPSIDECNGHGPYINHEYPTHITFTVGRYSPM